MKITTESILKFLKIISWLIFIGMLITTGVIIVSFILSFFNDELFQNSFDDGNRWYELKMSSNSFYNGAMFFNIIFSSIHAYIWCLIIQLFSKINMNNPFTIYLSKKLELIAYLLIALGILSIVGHKIFSEILRRNELKFVFELDAGYIFMAALIYIISQIFKRGIEIQEENELTV